MNKNKFLFGAATSSHQVEGNTHNDWTEWELGRPESKENPQNYISGSGADHYHRFREDFQIAKDLGHNATRFSIEWSRIFPEPGQIDEKEIQHYHEVLDCLKELGIEPVVTMFHFTSPIWFAQLGGFAKSGNLKYWDEYVETLVKNFGTKVKYWQTINEANIYDTMSYLNGKWPPAKTNIFTYFWVEHNLGNAHAQAYKIVKKHFPESQVGIAQNAACYQPFMDNFIDNMSVKIARYFNNYRFLNMTHGYHDFIGINYYFRNRLSAGRLYNPHERVSDLGWDLYPQGIGQVTRELYAKYKLPIFVTESGLADAKDAQRAWYITETLDALKKEMDAGIDIMGYLHWSLMDNFEWAEGFAPRFGLIEIDYVTKKRTIRHSAYVLRELAHKYFL